MLAPISWLKDYVQISLDSKKLGNKLTEVGLEMEKIIKETDDTVFELEITPNRPDCLSIIGIAREIAAIEKKNINYPKLKSDLKPKKILPLEIKGNPKINPRFSGIIIDGITVKESPTWLKKRLNQIGQQSINNVVDITNYVMFELGNPIHAFDYDKIEGHVMKIHQSKGGEKFKSVDNISYLLPKNAVVISDSEKIIDLCGIKGGYNTRTFENTKTIFIRVPVEVPALIRRSSQSLGLRSEASSIFERGVNTGGTLDALKRCVDLILELAGGEIASELYDLKQEKFEPWKLNLRLERLNKILGIKIPQNKVFPILDSLNLSPKLIKNSVECTIPTYRNDLKIEEDLVEEVARLYGYNDFPKTMPIGEIQIREVPYFKDYRKEEKIKNLLIAAGFSEVYTYSLISENDVGNTNIALRVDNPVSKEFEYLRPFLRESLIKAFKQNKPNYQKISLFELGKVYKGKSLDDAREEYELCAISNEKNYFEMKGLAEYIYQQLGIMSYGYVIEAFEEGYILHINCSQLLKNSPLQKIFKPLPKYPPIVEDLSFVVAENVQTQDIIEEIKKQSSMITNVTLLDKFEDSRTFHIIYRNPNKNLTTKEVSQIREKIISSLKEKFKISLRK